MSTLIAWLLIVLVTPFAIVWRMLRALPRPRRATAWRHPRTVTLTLAQARKPY